MMYDLMLELPIFQGLSHTQLTSILEKVPFHFKKYKPNDYLIRVGEVSDKVVFLLSGRVRVITPTYRDAILIAEDFEAPHTMAFYNMFGKETTTRSSVYAQGSVGVMELGKEHFLQMIADNQKLILDRCHALLHSPLFIIRENAVTHKHAGNHPDCQYDNKDARL